MHRQSGIDPFSQDLKHIRTHGGLRREPEENNMLWDEIHSLISINEEVSTSYIIQVMET